MTSYTCRPLQPNFVSNVFCAELMVDFLEIYAINLFVTSKNETTNLKCCIKARDPFKTPF